MGGLIIIHYRIPDDVNYKYLITIWQETVYIISSGGEENPENGKPQGVWSLAELLSLQLWDEKAHDEKRTLNLVIFFRQF